MSTIRVVLTLDGKQYSAELAAKTNETRKFGQEAAGAGTRATLLATAIRAAGYSFTAFSAVQLIRQISQTGIAFEQMQKALASVSSSAGEAQQHFDFVASEAERLGLELETTVRGYAQLTAATRDTALEGQNARMVFSAVSEAAATLGLSATDAAGVLRALVQIASKGTLTAEELRQQLGDRLPGAFQIAARAMGVTTAELNDMLQRGEIAAEVFLPAFALELRKTFGTDQSTRIDTTAASFTRLVNEIKLLGNEIATDLNPNLRAMSDLLTWILELRRDLVSDGQSLQLPDKSIASLEAMTQRLQRPRRGIPGVDSPFLTPEVVGGGAASVVPNMLGGTYDPPKEPTFYGALQASPLSEEQEKSLALLREEYELLQLVTHEEKALYQITEGRYREESKQAKDLILARAKLLDQKEAEEKLDRERQQAAERWASRVNELGTTYDPVGERLRELTQAQIDTEEAFRRGDISWEKRVSIIEGISEAYADLGDEVEETNARIVEANLSLQQAQLEVAEQGLSLARQVAGESKGMSLALLAVETAIAIKRIMINTEIAASRALAELGPTAGQAIASQIRAMGQISVGLVIASGAVQASQVSGGREHGGGVERGRIYEVGERGKPELLEQGGRYYLIPGAGGMVKPASHAAPSATAGLLLKVQNLPGQSVRAEATGEKENGLDVVKMIVDVASDSVASNGKLARAIAGSFGLTRKPVNR